MLLRNTLGHCQCACQAPPVRRLHRGWSYRACGGKLGLTLRRSQCAPQQNRRCSAFGKNSSDDARGDGDDRRNSGRGSSTSGRDNDETPGQSGRDEWEDDWGGWDDWGGRRSQQQPPPPGDQRPPHSRQRKRRKPEPRDEFLRPMIDATGARYRLSLRDIAAEEELGEEFDTNSRETRAAGRFAAIYLVAIPIITGFLVSRLLAEPVLAWVQEHNPSIFALSDKQKVEGAHALHKEEMRIRMDVAVGRSPPLTGDELLAHLHHEAVEVAEEMGEHNRRGLVYLLSDTFTVSTLLLNLSRMDEGRRLVAGTISRLFSGFSDTAKAFMIIVVTDTLLGYHSEGTWSAAIDALAEHYAFEPEEGPIILFIGIFPVALDAFFKYWIFIGLNKTNPAAAVTIRNMDRH